MIDSPRALCPFANRRARCVTLSEVNALLREQLDAAQEGNEALTSEIQQLTADWQRLREELETKEAGWRQEEQVGTRREQVGRRERRSNR